MKSFTAKVYPDSTKIELNPILVLVQLAVYPGNLFIHQRGFYPVEKCSQTPEVQKFFLQILDIDSN